MLTLRGYSNHKENRDTGNKDFVTKITKTTAMQYGDCYCYGGQRKGGVVWGLEGLQEIHEIARCEFILLTYIEFCGVDLLQWPP